MGFLITGIMQGIYRPDQALAPTILTQFDKPFARARSAYALTMAMLILVHQRRPRCSINLFCLFGR
jgi:hypothetical protein